jgi:hypothetical protein
VPFIRSVLSIKKPLKRFSMPSKSSRLVTLATSYARSACFHFAGIYIYARPTLVWSDDDHRSFRRIDLKLLICMSVTRVVVFIVDIDFMKIYKMRRG